MGNDSEFACEVVRITEILPHPDPKVERLELAHFEMKSGPTAYTVVVQKGQYSVGDFAVYVSVDAVVPLAGPESERWAFLASRLDGKGKLVYRIRAARLRGVYSEGILTPVPPQPLACYGAVPILGADFSSGWRISYHNPGPKGIRATDGTSTPRNVKAHKRLRQVKEMVPEYGVVSLRKAPFLFEDGERVVVTEKLHGTNFRFGWIPDGSGWEWFVGSHRSIKTVHESMLHKLIARLQFWKKQPDYSKDYYGEDLWTRLAEAESLGSRTKDYKGWVFYGEIYGMTENGKEVQKGFHYDSNVSVGLRLRLFDAYHVASKSWANSYDLNAMAADIEVDTVPVLQYNMAYNLDAVKALAEGMTTLGDAKHWQIREGVVVESLTGVRRKGKWVGEGYRTRKEVDSE